MGAFYFFIFLQDENEEGDYGNESSDPKDENKKVSDQLNTVLKELELLKTEKRERYIEKSRERSSGSDREGKRLIERKQSSSRQRDKNNSYYDIRDENNTSNSDSDFDSDNDQKKKYESYDKSCSEKKRNKKIDRDKDDRTSSRSKERERERERQRENERERVRNNMIDNDRSKEDDTIVAVKAMKKELSNIREDIQRRSTTPIISIRRENITPISVPFGGHFSDIGSLENELHRLQGINNNLRNELERSEKSCASNNKKINENVEEIRYKNDEIIRLKEFLENAKLDNKRIIRELRNIKDENEYVGNKGQYDRITVSKLEEEKLKMEASVLHEKIDSLLKEQQKVSYSNRIEIESKKSEIDHLTSQIAILINQNKGSGSVDSSSYQVCYVHYQEVILTITACLYDYMTDWATD